MLECRALVNHDLAALFFLFVTVKVVIYYNRKLHTTATERFNRQGCFMIRLKIKHCSLMAAISFVMFGNAAESRKNILFVFADDWGRYAGIYREVDGAGSPNDIINTPNVDRMAREGVLFRNAFVNAPSCTPCRSSLFSGRYFFNTGLGAILLGAQWDPSIPVFPLLLRDAGYHIGKSHKVWAPGIPQDAPFGEQKYAYEKAGRACNNFSAQTELRINKRGMTVREAHHDILTQVQQNFNAFIADRKEGQPWLYYFGTTTTHRKWIKGSGKKHWGINPDKLKGKMPKFFPDVHAVREDFADYLGECQAVDACIGELIARVEEMGELENTVIVISGDHGFPGAPRGKCNLYNCGTSVPLIIRWPSGKAGRVIDDFVMIPDLMPTFLEIGGVPLPEKIDARSLMPQITSDREGQIDPKRTWAISGRERHVSSARPEGLPYPMRALHTKDFLYIRNYEPQRWPMGAPFAAGRATKDIDADAVENQTMYCYGDFDASPTKAWLILNRDNPEYRRHHDWAFGKRPAEELYDMRNDPDQINNLASHPEYSVTRQKLADQLAQILKDSGDPRVTADPIPYEHPPYTEIGEKLKKFMNP